MVQFGQQDFTGLAGEVKPVLAPALAVPHTAGHSWDEAGGISSATDGKADKTPLQKYSYILGAQSFLHSTGALLPLPGCLAVNTLPSWRAKHIGADSSWKTWVRGAPGNLPPSSYVNPASWAC